MKNHRAGLCALAVVALTGAARADVITDWNTQLANAIRQAPAGPPTMARSGAMVFTAIYNAVNAVDQTHEPYGGFSTLAGPTTSREAAVAQAAHDVMVSLYPAPALVTQWNAQLATNLAAIPNGAAKTAGIALGAASASHIIALRTNDGTQLPNTYVPGANPGDWVPTQPGPAVEPNAGLYTPWGMSSGSQFRQNRLTNYGTMANLLASPEYAANYNDVKANGRINSWTPSDENYKIAFFWANDRNGTFKPPGHLNAITQTFAARAFQALSPAARLSREARLFALVNMAMADAGVCAWDCKYDTAFDLWRPITGIQHGASDGNPHTKADPAWTPLNNVDPDGPGGPMLADPFTPPFPAYISGHATFGAAQAAIMRNFFGGDSFAPLTIGTDDPYVPGLTRTFSSWKKMAKENGRSRIYLGVHWQWDADDGYTAGTGLANYIYGHYLRPLPLDSDNDNDNDGISDGQDSCPDSNLAATIVIEGCDTGVANVLLAGGCTMSDRIDEAAASARNHGAFVVEVAFLAGHWRSQGLIPKGGLGSIVHCAAHAHIP